MQWEKIKSEYPIAFTKACQWQSNLGVELSMRDRINQEWRHGFRWLYDFFDKQGLPVVIWFVDNQERQFDGQVTVCHDGRETEFHFLENWYSTRLEAEKLTFERAFSLLESKLTQPTQ
jgi:hypothetical protein